MTIETEGGRGRINRLEDPALLRGKGRFIDDIERSGMLEAAFVRSTFGHAEIRGIDTTAARELPGVHAVLTLVEIAAQRGLDNLYLGYWIKQCAKMNYKTDYRPLELFVNNRWVFSRA